jgi:type I restriction enzyme S subunit
MSSEWPVLPLEDCLDALIDYRGKTPEKTVSGIPLITAKVIKGGRIETPNEFIAFDNYDAWMRRGIPECGDVVLTVEAPLGEVAQLGPEKIALAQRVVTLRGKKGILDSTYLLYWLQSEDAQEQLKARATGTTVIGIKQSELRKLAVPIPPLDVQLEVAVTLQSLDDRITLLRETNATLEAIAQAIFKSWFVDFDPVRAKQEGRAPEGMDEATAALFPDSFEESELGLVPRGWRVGTLCDVLALRNERAKPSEETKALPYVPIESITAKVPFLQEFKSGEEANSSLILFREGDILFGAMRPYFHKVCIAPFDGVTRTTVFTLQARNLKTSGFALFLAFQETTIEYATKHSEGSTIPYAKWKKSLELMPIILPPESVQIAFCEIASAFVGRANLNVKQAQTLATLRDTLLPRLISGQLRLPDVEHQLEKVLS